jgi:hypothetical protein
MFSSSRKTAITNEPSHVQAAREIEHSKRLGKSFRQQTKAPHFPYPPSPSDYGSDYPSLLPDADTTEGTPVILKNSDTDHFFDDAGIREGDEDDSAFRQMLRDNEVLEHANDYSRIATASASTRKIMDTLSDSQATLRPSPSQSVSTGLPAPVINSPQSSGYSPGIAITLTGTGIMLFMLARYAYKSLYCKKAPGRKAIHNYTPVECDERQSGSYLLGINRPY